MPDTQDWAAETSLHMQQSEAILKIDTEKQQKTTKPGNHYWELLVKMQMKSMQECKERKIILHLQAVMWSLIVGITPVDLWTSMAEMQGRDSFAAINSLLTDEKQK